MLGTLCADRFTENWHYRKTSDVRCKAGNALLFGQMNEMALQHARTVCFITTHTKSIKVA